MPSGKWVDFACEVILAACHYCYQRARRSPALIVGIL